MPRYLASTITDVIEILDFIVDTSIRDNSRTGYFATLYRRVTAEVKGRIEKGRFLDPERMERLDVLFANRYLEAYFAYHDRQQATRSWVVAFEKARDPDLIVLQHMLLGMNAHINLDLGISAAEIAGTFDTRGFRDDFEQINDVLSDLVDEIQDTLGISSRYLRVADKLGGRLDEMLCGRALALARGFAWDKSQQLLTVEPAKRTGLIDEIDRETEMLAAHIFDPGGVVQPVLRLLRNEEPDDVSEVVSLMRQGK